jgi:PelA/Pel-15E family pectate lyase
MKLSVCFRWSCAAIVMTVCPGLLPAPHSMLFAQDAFDASLFQDGSHHWYDIEEEDKVIQPLPDQPKYTPENVAAIADNILLYQKRNGGWPKNYDVFAVLTADQRAAILDVKDETNTTFDNGTTHSHIRYLGYAYRCTNDARYREAALRGISFIISAQYPNGGWPQFWPDTSGYRKYITFNDGAMTGVMKLLLGAINRERDFFFVDSLLLRHVQLSFAKGLACILHCQYVHNGERTGWGQQHDNVTLKPQSARNFEPASLAGRESAEICRLLMRMDHPSQEVVEAVNAAVRWFVRSEIHGLRVEDFAAPLAHYQYRKNVDFDRKVVHDSNAPVIWARMYELETNVPLFCNRDKRPVYSLAEVERERRTGYSWYTYEPAEILKAYPAWQQQWSKNANALEK